MRASWTKFDLSSTRFQDQVFARSLLKVKSSLIELFLMGFASVDCYFITKAKCFQNDSP